MSGTGVERRGKMRAMVTVILLTVVLVRPSGQLTLRRTETRTEAGLTSLDRKLESEAGLNDNHQHDPILPLPLTSTQRDDEGSATLRASASDSTPPQSLRLAHQLSERSKKLSKGSNSNHARRSLGRRKKGPAAAEREFTAFSPQSTAGPARNPTARRHGPYHAHTAGEVALTEYVSGGQEAILGAPSCGGCGSDTTVVDVRPSGQSSADSTPTKPHASADTTRRVTGTRVPLQLLNKRGNHRPYYNSSTNTVVNVSDNSNSSTVVSESDVNGNSVIKESGGRSTLRSASWNYDSHPASGGSTAVAQRPRPDRPPPSGEEPPDPSATSVPGRWPGEGLVSSRALWRRNPSSTHFQNTIRLASLNHRRHIHHNHHHELTNDSPSPPPEHKPHDTPPPRDSQVLSASNDIVSSPTQKSLSPNDHKSPKAKRVQLVVVSLDGKQPSFRHENPSRQVLLGIQQKDLRDDTALLRVGRTQILPHQQKGEGNKEAHQRDDHLEGNSALHKGQSQLHPKHSHQSQQQRLLQHQAEAAAAETKGPPDVSRMVVTVVGSLTAILGACIMAAIFQCCCRRKRTTSDDTDGADEKRGAKQEDGVQGEGDKRDRQDGHRNSRSKSPSPLKVASSSNHDNHQPADTGLSEQDKLLEDDPDVGDFSTVCRETEILRSYRKPPPPKKRARASRVPRALKTVDPNASPDIFKELMEKESSETDGVPEPASRETSVSPPVKRQVTPVPNDMHSSMLADIDNTLAAMHSTTTDSDNTTPTASNPTSAPDSRRPSADKALSSSTAADNQLKPPSSKEAVTKSASREELARVLAEQLSRSVSKEVLASKIPGKTSTADSPKPQGKELTAKSRSAGPSPKLRMKELTTSHSQDNIRPSGGGNGESVNKDISKKTGGEENKDTTKKNGNGSKDTSKKNGGSGGSVKNTNMDVKNSGNAVVSGAAPAESGVADNDKKNGGGVDNTSLPSEKEGGGDSGNIFALIDPTAKGEVDDKGKSKIPIRAASNPTQPTAHLRPGSGKEKRFPVPSVHGEQMDQLLKSLKTRLKEDGSSPNKSGNKVSPEGATAEDDDLDPQGRNRSNSDPSRQQEGKKKTAYQTQL